MSPEPAERSPATATHQVNGILLGKELARSHVGVTYRGFAPPGNQPVIVKVGRAGVSELRVTPEVFAELNHPGIARLRAASIGPDGAPILAHDVPTGDPLTLAVARFDGQYRQIAHFMRAAAAVVEHAHELGVTHGDISPRTLHVDPEDAPLFCEFGMGLVTPESAKALGIEDAGGDSAAARERKFKVDERADMFALGAVLYFLLSGQEPTDQPLALMSDPDAPHDDIAPIDRVAPEAPTELRAICAQALATDPVHRYLHARGMVRDIDSYLHGKRRKPVVKIALAVVGAALVGLFGLWGSVGGGPARIVQVDVLKTSAGVAESLAQADSALTLASGFTVRVRLSRSAHMTLFYRDPAGIVHNMSPPGDQTNAIEFSLPAAQGGNYGFLPPPPAGLGMLVIVAHSDEELAEDWIVGTLSGLLAPPRSYAPLLLYGRHLADRSAPQVLSPRGDDVGRTHKSFPDYAGQLVRDLTARCDDAVIGLMYVLER